MGKKDVVMILIAGSLIVGLGFPIVSGNLKPLIVLSSSMEPVLSPGDMLIVKKTQPADIQRGDIMAFDDPSGRTKVLITHRVVRVLENKRSTFFRTKGDAVEEPDPFKVEEEDVYGKAIFNIPFLGYLFHYGQRPIVFLLLVILPALLIILGEVRKISEYLDPVKAHRAEKKDIKNERRIERNETENKKVRIAAILIITLGFFGSVSLPCLHRSGYNIEVRDNLDNTVHVFPTVLIYRENNNSIPHYEILTENKKTNLRSVQAEKVSAAPYILPVFWMGILANVSPFLPSLVIFAVYPIILTCLLYPLWRRPVKVGRRGEKK